MKKLFLIFSLLSMIAFSSCDKDSDNVETKSNALTIKVIDNDNNAVKGAHVFISSEEPFNDFSTDGYTDENGIFSIKEIAPQRYFCCARAEKNGFTYEEYIFFEITKEENKQLEMNPLGNSSSISVTVRNSSDNSPINGIKVYLCENVMVGTLPNEVVMNSSKIIGKTDTNGFIQFQDIPYDYDFSSPYVILAYDEKTGSISRTATNAYPRDDNKIDIYLDKPE